MAEGTKKIRVTLSAVEVEVPEDATDEQVADILDAKFLTTDTQWSTWTHVEDWRN